jgi:hypothetical protein
MRRRTYRGERRRNQRDGGMAIAMYRYQQRNKKPPLAKSLARELGKFFKAPRKPRKPRRR